MVKVKRPDSNKKIPKIATLGFMHACFIESKRYALPSVFICPLWLCPAGKSMSSPSSAPLRHTPESLGGGSRIRVQAVVGREGLDLLGLTHPAAALVVVLQAQSLACCLPVLVCTTLCSPQIEVEAAQRGTNRTGRYLVLQLSPLLLIFLVLLAPCPSPTRPSSPVESLPMSVPEVPAKFCSLPKGGSTIATPPATIMFAHAELPSITPIVW